MELATYSDKDLIDELKKRGYKVAKADRIRTASVQTFIHMISLKLHNDGLKQSIHSQLGKDLGLFLLQNGAVPVIEEIGEHAYTRRYRATATIVVDDPQFDWPYELKMEK
jgi:hypothetical protein